MALPAVEGLLSLAAVDRPELMAPPVAAALASWAHRDAVAVVEIDPAVADTAAMMTTYGLPMSAGANCVVVAGRRASDERIAACLVRSDMRADVNRLVKRTLDVRKLSFMPMERAVAESGMEYGGITPLGLPGGWRVLVDAAIPLMDVAIIGSGLRRSKLLVPGAALAQLPDAEVLPELGQAVADG